MAKWAGIIGYKIEELDGETGIWKNEIIEKKAKGDLLKLFNRNQFSSLGVNDNVNISNTISIVSDRFATSHLQNIVYVSFGGSLWRVESVEVVPPRLNLTIGGIYNGETT